MADVEAQHHEQSPVQPKPISRFSTCTSTRMAEANKHIVPMPRWMSITGVGRFILAILVLAFAAAATGIWGGYTAFGFTLFTASATLIIFAYYFVALSRKPALYNRWAVLGLEIFGVIFWIVSFALCADWTAAYNSSYWWGGGDNTRYGFWNAPFSPEDIGLSARGLVKRSSNNWRAGVACAGVAAGLGAVEFVLFAVTLAIFSMNLHKHRLAGSPALHRGRPTAPATAAEPAPAPFEKTEETKTTESTATETSKPQVLRKDSDPVV